MSNAYTARINRVMDHIEQNLDQPLRLEALARVACFSPYHFHRIFSAMTGEPLRSFIQRVRLEKAASKLIHNSDDSITAVALDCGFSSSAGFARAFRATFGMSASQWRDGGHRERKFGKTDRNDGQHNGNHGKAIEVSMGHFDPTTNSIHWRIEMSQDKRTTLKADITVEQLEPLHLAYLRHTGPYAGDSALFERLWGEMMKWAGPRGLFQPPETQMITVYHDDPDITEQDKLRLSVCLSVPADTEVGGEIGAMDLAGGAYAVARFELTPDQYGDAWASIYGGWLPESGYQPDDRPAFERCVGGPQDSPDGKHRVEICVPVKPL